MALVTWNNSGALDLLKLIGDNKIKLNDTPVSEKWFAHKYQNAIVKG